MTPLTIRQVTEIPKVNHRGAMELAETAYRRFLVLVRTFSDEDWTRQTDCALWDARALTAHVAGAARGCASVREMMRQQKVAERRAKENGTDSIDEWTGLHVEERKDLSGDHLVAELDAAFPLALKGRKRLPAIVRAIPYNFETPISRRESLGFLYDTIFTRDIWMHRVDLTRATGREMTLTSDHDGRIVAGVVKEWAMLHGKPFTLILDGPAGGSFAQGTGGEELRLDAVEFCRTLGGRGQGSGLLAQQVPF